MASRKVSDCIQEMQDKYIQFKARMIEAGIDFIITCTIRSQEEQDNLWNTGRSVFTFPCKCGGKSNKQGECKKHPFGLRVTWKKVSKHTLGEAFDIAILKNGKLTWDVKDYKQAGEIGESVGLRWGGRFKVVDSVHFEVL